MREALLQLTENGWYCEAGEFYIDPQKPVTCAVFSHAHADHVHKGCEKAYTHIQSKALLEKRFENTDFIEGIEYGQSFYLQGVRITLYPAGHVLGSAQIELELDGRVVIYSGDYKRDLDPTCKEFELRPCDTFISEATFSLPHFRWPLATEVVAECLDFWKQCKAENKTLFVGAYSLGKAQRFLAELFGLLLNASKDQHSDRSIYIHESIDRINNVYKVSGCLFPEYETFRWENLIEIPQGSLVLIPPGLLQSPKILKRKDAVTAMLSGWMLVRGQKRRRPVDRGFVLSDHADWEGIISTVKAINPKQVVFHHGKGFAIAKYFNEIGIKASLAETGFRI